jgi:hypothetical protein
MAVEDPIEDMIFAALYQGISLEEPLMKKLAWKQPRTLQGLMDKVEELKALILNDNSSAYYVYCFAHQLQLSLVAFAKKSHPNCNFFLAWLIVLLMLLEHHANIVTHFVKKKLLKLLKHYEIMKFLLIVT